MVKCSALCCKNEEKFKFPKNLVMRKKWLSAIKRTKFNPKPHNGLCKVHFAPADIVTLAMKTKGSNKATFECLRGTAVPRFFLQDKKVLDQSLKKDSSIINPLGVKSSHTNIKSSQTQLPKHVPTDNELNRSPCDPLLQVMSEDNISSIDSRLDESYNDTQDSDDIETLTLGDTEFMKNEFNQNDNEYNEPNRNFESSQSNDDETPSEPNTKACQTEIVSRYSIEQFKQNDGALSFFTGLRDYEQFMTIFYLLGPSVKHLNYVDEQLESISVHNQLFLVLWKLKNNSCDVELAHHFCIQKMSVRNIFASFIIFMSKQWSIMDGWPSPGTIDFCLPKDWSDNCEFLLNSVDQAKNINNQRKMLYQQQSTRKNVGGKYKKSLNQLIGNYNKSATCLDQDYMLLAREIIGVCLMLCHFKEKFEADRDCT